MNADIGSTLADALIKVTIVLGAGGLFAAMMANAAAAGRHLIWLLTISAALLMPALCLLMPAWRVLPEWGDHRAVAAAGPIDEHKTPFHHLDNAVDSEMPASAQSPHAVGAALPSPAVMSLPTQQSPEARAVGIAPPESSRRGQILAFSALTVWMAGTAMFLARLIVSWITLRRLATGTPSFISGPMADLLKRSCAELNLRRRVGLQMGGRHGMPMTWGAIRPVVLLPPEAEGWPANRVRLALLHELSHVKRLDALAQFITRLACAAYWFHPLIWVAAAGLRREQERAADDGVLLLGSCAPDYASFLLELTARRRQYGAGLNAAIAMARPAALEGRLRAILDAGRRRKPWSLRAMLASIALTAAFVGPVAALRGQAQPAASKAASTQPAEGGVRYAGHILSPDGKPVAGAEVFLRGYKLAWFQTKDLAAARTGADGAFVLATDPSDGKRYRPWIQVWAQGFGPVSAPVEDGKDQLVRLEAPSSVRVVFLSPDGLPVQGLRVMPMQTLANSSIIFPSAMQLLYYSPDWSSRFARTTDAGGACVFDMLPRISRTRLEIDDERFAQLSQWDVQTGAGPQSAAITIHLKAAGAISGKVTYGTTGTPAAGIRLIGIDRKNASGGGGFGVDGEIITNERGEYRIPQVQEGSYVIQINAHNDIGWTASLLKGVHVAQGRTTSDQNFVLVKGTLVRGRVYEADTGNPFSNALVRAVDLDTQEFSGLTETDAEGRYALRVPPGRLGIYLGQQASEGHSADDFDGRGHQLIGADGTPNGGFGPARYHEITAIDGTNLTFDMKLTPKPGKPVAGRVIDAGGKPLAEVSVRAEEPEEQDGLGIGGTHVLTDSEGRFRFRALAPGTQLSVIARDNAGTLAPVKVDGGGENVVLHVAKNIRTAVSGTVVDLTGKPIADAAVWLSVRWERYGSGGGQPATFTDSAGRFTIPDLLPDGHYSVAITADGFLGTRVDLKFTPGEERHNAGRISLKPVPSATK